MHIHPRVLYIHTSYIYQHQALNASTSPTNSTYYHIPIITTPSSKPLQQSSSFQTTYGSPRSACLPFFFQNINEEKLLSFRMRDPFAPPLSFKSPLLATFRTPLSGVDVTVIVDPLLVASSIGGGGCCCCAFDIHTARLA